MRMCVCACIHVCVCVRVFIVCVHVYMCMRVCILLYMCACVRVWLTKTKCSTTVTFVDSTVDDTVGYRGRGNLAFKPSFVRHESWPVMFPHWSVMYVNIVIE